MKKTGTPDGKMNPGSLYTQSRRDWVDSIIDLKACG
jgi:hypothetical protein